MKPYKYQPEMNQRLYDIRIALGKTQDEIGAAIGISGSRYGYLERRNGLPIKEHIVIALCNVYSVSDDYLLHGTGPMFREADARIKELEQLFSQLIEPYQAYLLDMIRPLIDLQNKEHPK